MAYSPDIHTGDQRLDRALAIVLGDDESARIHLISFLCGRAPADVDAALDYASDVDGWLAARAAPPTMQTAALGYLRGEHSGTTTAP